MTNGLIVICMLVHLGSTDLWEVLASGGDITTPDTTVMGRACHRSIEHPAVELERVGVTETL